jgi:Zeta toxin
MPTSPDLRDRVAFQIATLSTPGAPLHRDSDECTHHRYPITNTDRARFHRRTLDWYLSLQNPRHDGRTAIISAGPPGSGKTTMLHNRIPDIGEYRIIDADIIKDHIIEQALTDGIFDHLLSAAPLADGHLPAPRELSALVHLESVNLADRIRRDCVSRKENVVIEGTLTWHDQGPNIFRELAENDYTDIEVYGIDIDHATAHEQALNRWWQLRCKWIAGHDPLGGRFIPSDAIDICYPSTGGESVCTTNAKRFINTAIQTGEIPNVQVTIFRPTIGSLEVIYERSYRQ